MNMECCNTLVLDQRYDQARRRILAVLKEHGLQVEFDFDVVNGIWSSSGVTLAKSSVLGVDCPYQLLEAFVADGGAAVFFPLHVAIAEHGRQTIVRTIMPQALRSAGVAPAIAIPIHRTWRRIWESLDAISIRAITQANEAPAHFEQEAAHGILLEQDVKGR